MELLSVIRRWVLLDQLSIREFARRTGLSLNTIRKYLRKNVVEPAFKLPERPSKLDAFAEKLSGWLKLESSGLRKQKRTVAQLHADLVALGFEGSYGRIAAFARNWKERRHQEQQTAGRGTSFHWSFSRVRRSNLIGARIGRSSAAKVASIPLGFFAYLEQMPIILARSRRR